jgi:hypothetical protein
VNPSLQLGKAVAEVRISTCSTPPRVVNDQASSFNDTATITATTQ